jgi:hypothetical protein
MEYNRKLLTSKFPEIIRSESVPFNYRFIQLVLLLEVDENGNLVPKIDRKAECSLFQTEHFVIMGGHHKPISKLFGVSND